MRIHGGIWIAGVGVMVMALVGCAAMTSAVPSATATPEAHDGVSISPTELEASARAEEWIETTPMPEGAIRTDAASLGTSFNSHQAWVCSPTMTASAYWAVEGMPPTEVLNWMIENPAPGLTPTSTEPWPTDLGYDNFSLGFLPRVDAQEGVVFSFSATADGTALRAQSGAMTTDATCPTPPGGGAWGRPGEG